MTRAVILLALALMGASASPSRGQGITDPGERAFSYCFSCHTVDPNDATVLQGPNLAGVIARPIASKAEFEYSAALKSFAAGKVWTPELIAQFIQDPAALVPGTAMQKPPGPRSETERAALIDYLKKPH